jgi:hypothetical protein
MTSASREAMNRIELVCQKRCTDSIFWLLASITPRNNVRIPSTPTFAPAVIVSLNREFPTQSA